MDFIKCEALGNEFIVLIDTPLPSPEEAIMICNTSGEPCSALTEPCNMSKEPSRALAEPRDIPSGPGGDGIIHLAQKATSDDSQLWYPTVINCDGTDGGFSGNGLRCGALCILSKESKNPSMNDKFAESQSIDFEINGETIKAQATGNIVSLLFEQNYSTSQLPLTVKMKAVDYEGILNVNSVSLQYLNVGNPHLIINTEEEEPTFTDEVKGKLDVLRQHNILLTGGINVSIITKTDSEDYRITTFERGVGITPSCGSGALAALISLENNEKPLKSASFTSKGGIINLSKEDNKILMTGNVKKIFDGSYDMVNNTFTKK